jgi:D-sedoheptulose 7-phosphate isomerase
MTTEPTGFLYPFIGADEHDAGALLTDLATSARAKVHTSLQLQADTLDRSGPAITTAASEMAERFARGGRLHTFGNGGSSTDADGIAAAFRHPAGGQPALPASSLVEDRAILTALGNDISFDVVFARQLIAQARPADIALGISTSGGSVNVLAAFAEAQRRGLLTVGICGYDGGAMAASGDVAHCIVVGSDSVHRIQEAQDAVLRMLVREVHVALQVGGA